MELSDLITRRLQLNTSRSRTNLASTCRNSAIADTGIFYGSFELMTSARCELIPGRDAKRDAK
eukprot:2160522-Amphidinium_carterae.1